MDTKERVLDERLKKHCCSESVMNMCLEDMGWSEEAREPIVRAMGAYCGGFKAGLACGALCAGKAALFIAEQDRGKAHDELGPEMMEWFRDRFGAWNCAELLEGDESRKQTLCPVIIEETYLKARDILEDIDAV